MSFLNSFLADISQTSLTELITYSEKWTLTPVTPEKDSGAELL
jgi:hypothetical protein